MAKSTVNKEEYTMVTDWSKFNTKNDLLPCKCDECGAPTQRTLKSIDRSGGICLCKECSEKLRIGNMKSAYNVSKENTQAEIDLKFPDTYKIVGDDYKSKKTPILVEHIPCGYQWKVSFDNLMKSNGKCPECNGVIKKTHEQFVKEVTDIHGDKYSILGKYENMKTPILTRCGNCGNEWEVNPQKLLREERKGCPECGNDISAKTRSTTHADFLDKMSLVHPDIIILSEYVNNYTRIDCECKICKHKWNPEARSLIQEQGCPICANIRRGDKIRHTAESFIKVYNERFPENNMCWDNFYYTGYEEKTTFRCKEHNQDFISTPGSLMLGNFPCSKCNPNSSKAEEEVRAFVESLGLETNKGKLSNNVEVDICIPSMKIGIEYHGLYYHNELHVEDDYHLRKLEQAIEDGITLIQIFEDEWVFSKDIVKSILKYKLNKMENNIFARKCQIKEVDNKTTYSFLNENHLQGYCNTFKNYALFYNNEIVALITFSKNRMGIGSKNDDSIEISRFAVKKDYNIVGGFSKLLKHSIKNNPEWSSLITYADRRWSEGNLYLTNGFEIINCSKPNYWFYKGSKRIHRLNYRKSELVKMGYDKNKSEHEITLENKMYRVYDCGSITFKYNIK